MHVIGRGTSCSIQLSDPSISRTHCRLQVGHDAVVLSDAGSTWGTHVNGRRISKHQLRHEDVIIVGDTKMLLSIFSEQQTPHAEMRSVHESESAFGTPPQTAIRGRGSSLMLPGSRYGTGSKYGGRKSSLQTGSGNHIGSPLGDLHVTEAVGKQFGNYELKTFVAQGTFGADYMAIDRDSQEIVTLRIIWPEILEVEENFQIFESLIQPLIGRKHPQLCTYLATGVSHKLPWIASEYIQGENLAEYLMKIKEQGLASWEHCFQIFWQLAQALKFIADADLVHGCIGPPCVWIRKLDQRIKVADLMLLSALSEAGFPHQTRSKSSQTGLLPYQSPEQTLASPYMDWKSDSYSVGATIYALLVGHPPFSGNVPAQVMLDIQQEYPPRPARNHPGLPNAFEELVMKLLEKRPDSRFRDPTNLIEQIEIAASMLGIPLAKTEA